MIIFVGIGSVTAVDAQATAASTNPVAVWQMNEAKGARVMTDTSGHHLNGSIGSKITTGFASQGNVGYSFPRVDNHSPYDAGHVVTVSDTSLLDPGTGNFSVTASFDWTMNNRNIVQKGQEATSGGDFKMEVANGLIACLFRGASGNGGVHSPAGLVKQGEFHTVTCTRTATQVQMTVDGKLVRTIKHATGNISNSAPLSIGGKTSCNGSTVECDPFGGVINRIEIDRPS
jgi:Concanavalin A-like lectin/glucanases superfamily